MVLELAGSVPRPTTRPQAETPEPQVVTSGLARSTPAAANACRIASGDFQLLAPLSSMPALGVD